MTEAALMAPALLIQVAAAQSFDELVIIGLVGNELVSMASHDDEQTIALLDELATRLRGRRH
jgi:hypothetical protein